MWNLHEQIDALVSQKYKAYGVLLKHQAKFSAEEWKEIVDALQVVYIDPPNGGVNISQTHEPSSHDK